MIQLSKIVLIFCLIGALTGHTGCSKPEAPLVKPEIVRKKINENTGESVKTEPVSVMALSSPGAPPLKPEIVRKKIYDKPESVKAAPVSGVSRNSFPMGAFEQTPYRISLLQRARILYRAGGIHFSCGGFL